jgi:hypothetical protein
MEDLLAGKEVTMEITLRDADLFSFRFFDSQSVKA